MPESQDPADLSSIIRAIEPAARLVPIRSLRRAIRLSEDEPTFRVGVVHDRSWWIDRDALFRELTPQEFGLKASESTQYLLLLPTFEGPLTSETARILWRRLFHAAIDRAFDDEVRSGAISAADATDYRRRLGPASWHVIRLALIEENLIDRDATNLDVLREFIAFGSEVAKFDAHLWTIYFPGINQSEEQFRELSTRLRTEEHFELMRSPMPASDRANEEIRSNQVSALPVDARPVDLQAVEAFSARGNDLRAAIDLARSGQAGAAERIDRLVERLSKFLEMSQDQAGEWRVELRAILTKAASGGWPHERRLLYELQRACLAMENPPFAADIVEWLITLGRRPIKRPLPRTRWVEVARRFRAALKHAEQLAHEGNATIVELVEHAKKDVDQRARDDLRPHLTKVLDDVGLVPLSIAEGISRDKLIEELLDTACSSGFLRIGDLRDAIARNRVKLLDLAGPVELLRGDAVIRANRMLAVELDGVYRRGEIYMRALQRGCSLFFGTKPGRLFTRFVALPFGGAFLLLEAVNHMIEAGEGFVHWLSGWSATVKGFSALSGGAAGTVAENPSLGAGGVSWTSVIAVGIVLFMLIHWRAFRGLALKAAKLVLFQLPKTIFRSPLIRSLFHNRITRLIRRYLFFPLLAGGLASLAVHWVTEDWVSSLLVGGGVALFMATFFRTPIGRGLEDRLDEAASRFWRIMSVNFVLGLLTLILQVFQAVFHAIDQTIYTVDERLRFREGQSRGAFAVKVLFGGFWFLFTYLFRFAWTLLVEPQINPIKHFPVVTVSHKMLLPLIPSLARQFRISEETMGSIVFGIPGIFGFLVWELKENWKLYRANASPTIRPAMVGSHGEKVRALLRPGFHSGVIPKTFAKLRRAARNGDAHKQVKYLHGLHHIAEAIERLADRELLPFLHQSPQWRGKNVRIELPVLTPNRILLEVLVDDQSPIVISLEERGGWVIGSIEREGEMRTWTPEMREIFASALAGFYKLAGVHAIREQVAELFGPQSRLFDATPEGLVIRMTDDRELFFAYDDAPELIADDQAIAASNVVFSRQPLAWNDWVEWWDANSSGKTPTKPLVPGWKLLP